MVWRGSDIYASVAKAFGFCDDFGIDEFRFDEDGLGAGARGDARVINEHRYAEGLPQIIATPFRGAALYLIRKMKLFPATTANRHV
jgi:hypothetical protein